MPISHSIQVHNLIKSLTKAEKRNFRIYAKRIQQNEDLMFLKLFDLMDKQKELNETTLLKQLGNIEKSKYSNLKRHLYSQIIASLRMIHKEKRANFKVREYIDYAYILYGKGLYLQALKIIQKAKVLAEKNHLIYMRLTLVEFEKFIENRHITRSGGNKALNLVKESEDIQSDANHLVLLSNLRIKMHAKYIQHGHVRKKEEAEKVRAFFHEQIDHLDLDSLGLMERIFYVQSRVWYNYILLDFESCIKYAKEWVDLFENNPTMIDRDVDLYLRGFHYVLTTANHIKDRETHKRYLEKFEHFRKKAYAKFNHNSQILSFLYVHSGRLDDIILNGKFDDAKDTIKRALNRINRYSYKLDDHKVMIFYFKFSWIYLGNENYSKALFYINKIVNNELNKLREDIQNYARIMQLICHYEIENFEILNYLINNASNFFKRKKGISDFLQYAINMFKELESSGPFDHKTIFKKYLPMFQKLDTDPYERRALVYINIIDWLESKINNTSLQKVVQDKIS